MTLNVCLFALSKPFLARETQCLLNSLVIYTPKPLPCPQTVAAMRSLAMVVIPALVILTMVEAQYGGGSCDWSQCRYDRYDQMKAGLLPLMDVIP